MDSPSTGTSGIATPSSGDYHGSKNPMPRSAMASFENLVALANHYERLKEARKLVWRDKGQPVIELHDFWACLRHAGRGGLRAGMLAFNIRASVNLVLVIIRARKVQRCNWKSIVLHGILGTDTMRFAAMLGTFVALYKLIINSLPIACPGIDGRLDPLTQSHHGNHDLEAQSLSERPKASDRDRLTVLEVALKRRRARLTLTPQAHQKLIRKKTRRWHATLAGAVAGGLAVMFEIKSRRIVIGQQLFVRGLQGSWNAFASKRGIRIPHGDVIVFSLACGQIMYAFLLRPDTLPRSYNNWIDHASKVPTQAIKMNRDITRDNAVDLLDLEPLIHYKGITPANYQSILAFKDCILDKKVPSHIPCSAIHPWLDSCLIVPFDRFLAVFRWMLPIYGALHLIPAILFKWKSLIQNPRRVILRSTWGTCRSSAFLGMFVVIYQSAFCFKHFLHDVVASPGACVDLPQNIKNILVTKPSFWFLGLLTGLSLFVEEKRRRGELAMYVLPKGLESAWVMARGKGLVFKTGQWGEVFLTAVGMGMVMNTYQNHPQHLSGLVRRILYQFIGPN